MNIEDLQAELKIIMPMLNANMAAAHKEYMDGEIPAGAVRYIRDRHSIALLVTERGDADFPTEDAFVACAPLTIDVRSACDDAGDYIGLERWLSFFDANGFTERHPFFKTPIRPTPPTGGAKHG